VSPRGAVDIHATEARIKCLDKRGEDRSQCKQELHDERCVIARELVLRWRTKNTQGRRESSLPIDRSRIGGPAGAVVLEGLRLRRAKARFISLTERSADRRRRKARVPSPSSDSRKQTLVKARVKREILTSSAARIGVANGDSFRGRRWISEYRFHLGAAGIARTDDKTSRGAERE
jgi:hypothetical protein